MMLKTKNGLIVIVLLVLGIYILMNKACIPLKPEAEVSEDPVVILVEEPIDKTKEKREKIIGTARDLIGSPYSFAGKTPAGFDCSGFTGYVMKKHGIKLKASSSLQSTQGKSIELADLKPGDLIFFGFNGVINHVGLVSLNEKGKFNMIHASSSRGIIEEDINKSSYWKQRVMFGRQVLN